MALDIVKLYISLISDFFKLSDMAVMTSPSSNTSTLPLIPADSHSLATAHYLLKLLSELQESVNELNGMEISSEASSSLKNLLESARWRFTDILVNAWRRGEFTLRYPRLKLMCERCPCVLLPRGLDSEHCGFICHSLSRPNWNLPATTDHCGLQARRGRRPIVILSRQVVKATPHTPSLCFKDCQSIYGHTLCIFWWIGPSSLGSVTHCHWEETNVRGYPIRWA